MSIIADTLQRLQATKGNSEPKDNSHASSSPQSSYVRKSKGPTRAPWLKFCGISLALILLLGGLGFSAYWVGLHFDVGLLSYGSIQPEIPVSDRSPAPPNSPGASNPQPVAILEATPEPAPHPEMNTQVAEPQGPQMATIKVSSSGAQPPAASSLATLSSQSPSNSPKNQTSNSKVSTNPQQTMKQGGHTPSLPHQAIPELPKTAESDVPSSVSSPTITNPLAVTMNGDLQEPPSIKDNLSPSQISKANDTVEAKPASSELPDRNDSDQASPHSPAAIVLHEEQVAPERLTALEAASSPDTQDPTPKVSYSSIENKPSAKRGHLSKPSANRLQTAKELIQQREYEGAVSLLSPVFNDPPVDWEPWFWMGTALLGKGQLDQADQFFLSGMARNDKIPQLWIQRALVAQQRGDYQLAIYELRQAESLDGTLPHVPLNLGYAYEKLGNERLATQYYGKFLKLSEGNPVFFETREKLFARIAPHHPIPNTSPGSPAPIRSMLETGPR